MLRRRGKRLREALRRAFLPREVKEVREKLLKGEVPRGYKDEHLKGGLLEAIREAGRSEERLNVLVEVLKKDRRLRNALDELQAELHGKLYESKAFKYIGIGTGGAALIYTAAAGMDKEHTAVAAGASLALMGIGAYHILRSAEANKLLKTIEKILEKVRK